MSMHEDHIKELISAAANARLRAYAPYSNFKVGAALLTADNQIVTACNVENASYGLAICAERNAICQSVAKGMLDFKIMVVVTEPLATPCGACRQFISEFGSDTEIVCASSKDLTTFKRWKISDLLPESFDGSSLRNCP